MRLRNAIIAAIFCLALCAPMSAQIFQVKEFQGRTVGEKLTTAQSQCIGGTVNCILIFAPELVNYSLGSMPARCPTCTWFDYTTAGTINVNGAPVGSVSSVNLGTLPTDFRVTSANCTTGACLPTFDWSLSLAPTFNNLAGAIVRRDVSGNFSAGQITANGGFVGNLTGNVTGNLTGNASTTSAFITTPTLCTTGNAPTGILANGNATGCASVSALWNTIGNPGGNLALTMGANTSTWTYNAATGANNLWVLKDTAGNNGTGFMMSIEPQNNSAMNGLRIFQQSAINQGTNILQLCANGCVTQRRTFIANIAGTNNADAVYERWDSAALAWFRSGNGTANRLLFISGTDATKFLWEQNASFDGLTGTDVGFNFSNKQTPAYNTTAPLAQFVSGSTGAIMSVQPSGTFASNNTGFGITIANTGGVAESFLVKISVGSNPSVIAQAATTDTDGVIGICEANCIVGGSLGTVATSGIAKCFFDGAATAGDYVQTSTTVAGKCHDTGSTTRPGTNQVIGRVLQTNAVAGQENVLLLIK